MRLEERAARTIARLDGRQFTATDAMEIINEYPGRTINVHAIIPTLKKYAKLNTETRNGRCCIYEIIRRPKNA